MPAITTASLIEAAVLGIALAMDAMAVTLSNSLCEPDMPMSKKLGMPIAFALFQMGMPVLGYLGGTLIAEYIERYARIVSLVILVFVGGKMIVESVRELREPESCPATRLTWATIGLEAACSFLLGSRPSSGASEGAHFPLPRRTILPFRTSRTGYTTPIGSACGSVRFGIFRYVAVNGRPFRYTRFPAYRLPAIMSSCRPFARSLPLINCNISHCRALSRPRAFSIGCSRVFAL